MKKLNKFEKMFIKSMVRTGALIIVIMGVMKLLNFSLLNIGLFTVFALFFLFFAVKPYYWNYFSKLELEELWIEKEEGVEKI